MIKLVLQWLPCQATWCWRVSAGTGWPSVSKLWLGEIERLICNLSQCRITHIGLNRSVPEILLHVTGTLMIKLPTNNSSHPPPWVCFSSSLYGDLASNLQMKETVHTEAIQLHQKVSNTDILHLCLILFHECICAAVPMLVCLILFHECICAAIPMLVCLILFHECICAAVPMLVCLILFHECICAAVPMLVCLILFHECICVSCSHAGVSHAVSWVSALVQLFPCWCGPTLHRVNSKIKTFDLWMCPIISVDTTSNYWYFF